MRFMPLRNVIKLRSLQFGLCLLLLPALCLAWFNEQWSSRKQISLDAAVTGADIQETLSDFPLLIRLHTGNFAYFMDLADKGRDIRVLKDDKTPLSFQVEQLDALNNIGLLWVRMPQVHGGVENDNFWLYYGNGNAPDASNSKSLYDAAQSLVYHFQAGESLPQDATAYLSHAAASKAQIQAAGWIGAAAQFNATGPITVNPAPQLAISAEKGWTFSSWLKLDQPQTAAKLLEATQDGNGVAIAIQGAALVVRWQSPAGVVELPAVNLSLGRWQYVTLVLKADTLSLYLDGVAVGNAAIRAANVTPALSFGSDFVGLLDEIQIAATARSPDWIKLAYRSQSPDFSVLNFGQDETNSSGDGHFQVIVQNVTPDGWLIIGLTGVMLMIALLVIISKTLLINRIGKDNRLFMDYYQQLDSGWLAALNPISDRDSAAFHQAQLWTKMLGPSEQFQNSPLYKLYDQALSELNILLGGGRQAIGPEAWQYLRVLLNSRIVAESRALNHNMVLLTIAIAGGPFLGLLGTVVGVMITFADIAATGDVNINSIAPGISAALLATVAGLAVAIPALFAYNYLLSRIKEITSGMRVFADEFLALLAMRLAQNNGSSRYE